LIPDGGALIARFRTDSATMTPYSRLMLAAGFRYVCAARRDS